MIRICKGVEKADGHGFNVIPDQLRAQIGHIVQDQRFDHVAPAVHAFAYFEAQGAGDQWFREHHEQVIDVIAHLLGHFQDVAKAFGGDQGRLGAFALNQRVGDECCAMNGGCNVISMRVGGIEQVL